MKKVETLDKVEDSAPLERFLYLHAGIMNKSCNIAHAINTDFRCILHVK